MLLYAKQARKIWKGRKVSVSYYRQNTTYNEEARTEKSATTGKERENNISTTGQEKHNTNE